MFPETGQVLTVQDTSLTATEVAVQRLKEALPDLARRVGETELPADVRVAAVCCL
jgi:hypothetical protein